MSGSSTHVAARRARWAVSAHFLVMGLTGGVWMARIPAAKTQAHLSNGMLGVALFAVPAGLMLGAAVAERFTDRTGSAPVMRVSAAGSCLFLTGPGLAHGLPELMAALLGFGLAGGALDVATNAQGVRVEAAYGRPVITSMHAFYSSGAIAGALAGGGLAWAGVSLLPSLAVAGLAGLVIDGLAGRWLLPGTHHDPAAGPVPPAALAGRPPWERRHVRRLTLAVGFLAICGLVGEGAAGDWSAVYLRDSLGTSAGFAALAFAAFSATMTAGRASGDWLIHRFGVVPVIRACGAVAAAGLVAALLTTRPAAVIAGFAVFGAGLSAVVPQAFAAGGRVDPDRPGSGIARVVGLGYTGMTAGPAVIGVLAAATGLRLALAVLVVLTLWIVAGASVLAVPGDAGATERSHAAFRDEPRALAVRDPRRATYRTPMEDQEILVRISDLIRTEHELRDQLVAGQLTSEQEQERLRYAEEALDQCWDLLRQRRARREFGENPDGATPRPAGQVEAYEQLSSRPGRPVGSLASGGAKEHCAYREVCEG